ncbi:MAG TPA: GNAT family N-acetyltransferase [Chitinophagaceae bacterium]|jgi:GNAT superfamily N-acetyltransferase|nr:GNAT family N-acetyltransferase [Chitinophagaceae bacterium]
MITNGNYSISTDKSKLDVDYIHSVLSKMYWSENIPRETVQRCIDGSFCFAVYDGEKQIGFARVITDLTTFGYLADVFIDESYRGKGLGKWLVQTILEHSDMQGFRRWLLATRDAHSLYAGFGFTELKNPERFMQIHNPAIYKQSC